MSATTSATTPAEVQKDQEDASNLAFLRGTTLNFALDGYYGYNFNEPIGRVNQLRAYDISSNSFSINQADIVVEHLPTPQERFGGRLDLMWGQAAGATQCSSANEPRPNLYCNLFQAYGSYLAPIGSGLQVDFGKFSSALGAEGNYTKDQITYSRSYSFDFLPFYHMGFRANYNFSPKVNVAYWLVNGAQQTEDFNGFKSQALLLTLKPSSAFSWNVNYYFGQEQPDVTFDGNSLVPLPQPGLPTGGIYPVPNGREHIFDSYATWNPTKSLMIMGEGDFVVNRTFEESPEEHAAIGAAYLHYALPRNWSVGARAEYFDDPSGLFSGQPQDLHEFTFVADHLFAPGFLARAEYRRDWSNQRLFLTDTPGYLVHAQPTATLGLVYWWGTKQGSW